jgi:putative ABC transport system permease protein
MIEPGRAPGPGEIVIDKRSADKGDLHLGDAVTVLTRTGPQEFTFVGNVRFGSADSPGGASVSLFDHACCRGAHPSRQAGRDRRRGP